MSRAGVASALLCAVVSLLAVKVPGAQANRISILGCHGPGGEALGHAGWVTQRTSDGGMAALDTCAGEGRGSLSLELGGNSGGYGDSARIEWVFAAPPWASIVSYAVQIADSQTATYAGGGVGQAFVNASDETDPYYDYRNLGYGALGASAVERVPPAPDSQVTLNASCDGQNGRCAADARIARLDVSATRVTLNDPTTPTVTSLAGSMLSAGPLRERAALNVQAADEGPGVYSAALSIDGIPQAPQIFDSNGGWCQSLGPSAEAPRSFAHPNPCPAHASTTIPLETATLADGRHTLTLSVDDASGNATTALETTIETRNAPQNTAAPAILGPENGALSAQPGSWSAPPGAGAVSYGYSWQQCDASGANCAAIPGADTPTLPADSVGSGHTVRVLVSAGDRDGIASAASATTPVLSAAPGIANGFGASEQAKILLSGQSAITRSFADSALRLSGALLAPGGTPIAGASLDVVASTGASSTVLAHAQTDADGRFQAQVPRGPSRVVAVAYRGFSLDPGYSASASVHESVRAGVQLDADRRRTSPQGRVTFSGRVLGAIPRPGVIVELLVRYRGQWQPIRTPRTRPDGRFRLTYVFQGATGTFPFRVLVPGGQAGFAFTRGASPVVQVRTG